MAFQDIHMRSAGYAFFEKLQQIKKGYRMLIVFGLMLVLAGAFAWFVYLPRLQEIDRTEKTVADLRQKIQAGKVWDQKLADLQKELAQAEKDFERTLNILPNEREIPSLLASISQLGVDSNLLFRLFSPGKEDVKNFYVEIPVSVEVGGGFRDVILFLDKVSRMERIVNIMDISIKPSAPLSNDLITACKAVTYRFKTKEDEAKEKAQKQEQQKKK